MAIFVVLTDAPNPALAAKIIELYATVKLQGH